MSLEKSEDIMYDNFDIPYVGQSKEIIKISKKFYYHGNSPEDFLMKNEFGAV